MCPNLSQSSRRLVLGALVLAVVPLGVVHGHSGVVAPTPPPSPASAGTIPDKLNSSTLIVSIVKGRNIGGAYHVKGKMETVNQAYVDGTQRRYLFSEISLPIPIPELGIATVADARNARFTISYVHAGDSAPYAECVLAPRQVSKKKAVYTLGIKEAIGREAVGGPLIRWGNCDDAQLPGNDSVFPAVRIGDVATLKGPGDFPIRQFSPPVAQDSVTIPTNTSRKPQPDCVKLMENTSFKYTRR